MRLTNSQPTRFDPATMEKMKRLAERHQVKLSWLIRQAVAAALPAWEKDGITLTTAR